MGVIKFYQPAFIESLIFEIIPDMSRAVVGYVALDHNEVLGSFDFFDLISGSQIFLWVNRGAVAQSQWPLCNTINKRPP